MDKCEGCLFNKWWTNGGTGQYQFRSCGVEPDDCHLTLSDMTAIKSAIAGEGRLVVGEMGDCRTCEKLDYGCPYDVHTIYDHTKSKCPDWQDQGGE